MSSSSSQAKTTSTTTGAGLHPSPSRGSGQSPSGLSQLVNPSLPGSRLPPKLRKKILDLEYIEMAELLPESWQAVEETLSCCHQSGRRLKRAPVTDILTWLDCYATLVAVLCTVYAQFSPEFMAYQKTILKAARDFEGTCWVTYDSCYRRQAALNKDLSWSRRDPDLYQEAFTGRARAVSRCAHCLSREHASSFCHLAPPESHRPQPSLGPSQTPSARHKELHVELCGLYNRREGNACRFKSCKYVHACKACHQPHPLSSCTKRIYRDRSPLPRRD